METGVIIHEPTEEAKKALSKSAVGFNLWEGIEMRTEKGRVHFLSLMSLTGF